MIMNILRKKFQDTTDARHNKDIESLVLRIFQNKKRNVEKISKDWLENVYTRQLNDYTCAGWIAGYPFTNTFKIADITITPNGSKEYKNFKTKFTEKFGVDLFKIKPGMNAAFVCKVKAYDEESCELISNIYVNRVLYFIKLLDPTSEIRLQIKDYNTSNTGFFINDKNGTSTSTVHEFRKGDQSNITYNFDK